MKISNELKKAYEEKLRESKKAEKDAKKAEKLYIDAQLSNKLQNATEVSITNDNLRTLIVNTTCEDLKIAFSSVLNTEQFYTMLYNELATSERIIRIQKSRSEKAKRRKNAKSNSELMLENVAANAFNALGENDLESIVGLDTEHKDQGTEY